MGKTSSIEWLRGDDGSEGGSWNMIRAQDVKSGKRGFHCERVNGACAKCYAASINKVWGTRHDFKPGLLANGTIRVYLDEDKLLDPITWSKARKIFPCSMTDLFADFVPDEWIIKVWAIMAYARWHTYIVLTKRPERMARLTNSEDFRLAVMDYAHRIRSRHDLGPAQEWPLRNVIGGTSASNQEEADAFVPHVIDADLAYRCVSLEPLRGRVNLMPYLMVDNRRRRLSWVITGGESGAGARPDTHPDDVRYLRDQCKLTGTAFHFKQWGTWGLAPAGLNFKQAQAFAGTRRFEHLSNGETLVRFKRKAEAGRLLDGVEHDGFPVAA
jgi:protein gp37